MQRLRNALGLPLIAVVLLTHVVFAQSPGTPTNVQAIVNGTILNVSWTAPGGTPVPTGYRLDFRAGATPVASFSTTTTSVAIPIPPGVTGTFTVTVTALVGSTAGSPSGPATFILGGGGCVPPVTPERVTGRTSLAGLTEVVWTTSASATGYAVRAGTTQGSSNLFNGIVPGDSVSGTLPGGLRAFLSVSAVNTCGQSAPTHDLGLPPPSTCAVDGTTACAFGGRFLIQGSARPPGASAPVLVPIGSRFNDGAALFLLSSNIDVLVQIINSCSANNRYWVFASGLSNVELSITVTDTQRGTTKQYFNPQGRAFPPIQDTSAFATCP